MKHLHPNRRRVRSALRRVAVFMSAIAAVAALAWSPLPAQAAGPGEQPEVDTSVLYAAHTDGYACFRIPSVVRTTAGTILAFAEGRIDSCNDDASINIVVRRSTDDGLTFGPVTVVADGHGDTQGNPTAVVDSRSGRITLLSTWNPHGCLSLPQGCERNPYVQWSTDDGQSWTQPLAVPNIDRPDWTWYGTGPGHGIQLTSGKYRGRLVVPIYYDQVDNGVTRHGAGDVLSDDGGLTWRIGGVQSSTRADTGETTVVERTNGSLLNITRATGKPARSRAVSYDGGQTLTPWVRDPNLMGPDVEASSLRLQSAHGPDTILLSSPVHPATREVMTVGISTDDGRTFQQYPGGKVVTWGPAAYSDLVQLGPDRAGLLYEGGDVSPYEQIRWVRFNRAWLATPNGTPPGFQGTPAPGPLTPDRSPAHNTAYVRGGASLTAGKFGHAIALDGNQSAIRIPFNPSIDVGAGDFTMTTWFKYDQTTGTRAIAWMYRMNRAPQFWVRGEPTAHRLRALIDIDGHDYSVSSASAYNDGLWHFLVMERVDGQLRMMVDGQQVGSVAVPAGSVTEGADLFGAQGLTIGQRLDGADEFIGSIDEFRLYRNAVSDADLQRIQDDNTDVTGTPGALLAMNEIDPAS